MTGYVMRFEELGRESTAEAGGKGANLGELARAGLPVPPGFVVTAQAFLSSMEEAGVRAELAELQAKAGAAPPEEAAELCAHVRSLVRKAGISAAVRDAIAGAYAALAPPGPVAVRSSATSEDTAGTSFAGMNETFTNTWGEAEVLDRVLDCWTSLYGERVVSYRAGRGVDEEPAIAVVVQEMVDSERSGVMFTADPSTGDRGRIIVEGAFGLGEVVVDGQVEPDTYAVAKDGPRLVEVRVGQKAHKVVRGADGHDQRVELTAEEGGRRVLTD